MEYGFEEPEKHDFEQKADSPNDRPGEQPEPKLGSTRQENREDYDLDGKAHEPHDHQRPPIDLEQIVDCYEHGSRHNVECCCAKLKLSNKTSAVSPTSAAGTGYAPDQCSFLCFLLAYFFIAKPTVATNKLAAIVDPHAESKRPCVSEAISPTIARATGIKHATAK